MTGAARPIVVVIGMHRSGTSLCAHLLTRLGYDMTDDPVLNKTNPKGHWERMEIVGFHDRILRHFDRDYYSPNHAFALPPGWWADAEVRKIRNELIAWLRERMGSIARFGFKDPRMCLMFPLWKEICGELNLAPRYVYCVRDPAQVVRSIAERDRIDPSDSEYRWVRYNAHAVAGVADSDVAVIRYDDWFAEPSANLDRLAGHLQAFWQAGDPILLDAVRDVIAPDLRHDAGSAALMMRSFTRDLYQMLIENAGKPRTSADLRAAARHFIAVEQLHAYKQAEWTALARKSGVEEMQKSQAALTAKLEGLQAALDQEKAVGQRARAELASLRPTLAAAQEQGRRSEAALVAARQENRRLRSLPQASPATAAAPEEPPAAALHSRPDITQTAATISELT